MKRPASLLTPFLSFLLGGITYHLFGPLLDQSPAIHNCRPCPSLSLRDAARVLPQGMNVNAKGAAAASDRRTGRALRAEGADNLAVDPFAEANYPLRVIRVASHDKDGNELDKPLYGIPLTYMSVHHNEYISTQMETDYYGPTWWFRNLGLVQKDRLLVDVGFNIGAVGLIAAAQGMRVIGFEPVKANWLLASQSLWLNGFQKRAKVFHAAVHWKKETMRIQHNFSLEADGKLNAGQGTLGEPVGGRVEAGGGAGNVEYVDTLSLDDVVREDVWLMKLDVEGCECHCLKSGQKLFASGKVNYVFIETDRAASNNCGCTGQWFVDFFTKHNYVACKKFEGTKAGHGRTCTETEKMTGDNWFSRHDRFLRHADAPVFPGHLME